MNLELNFCPVLKNSGSNFGSEPNFGITKTTTFIVVLLDYEFF